MVDGLRIGGLGGEIQGFDELMAIKDFVEAVVEGGPQRDTTALESLGHAAPMALKG
jgi:hypothetical protein